MKTVRLIDIADAVGVSRITVSKVLLQTKGNKTSVSPETASRIMDAARQMGYRPNTAARQLAGVGSKLIGVLIDAHGLSVEYPRVSYEEEAANALGYRLVVGQCRPAIAEIKSYIDDFVSRGIDGVIIHAHAAYPELREELLAAASALRNVVYYDRPDGDASKLNYVDIDLAAGMRKLVSRIAASGRKRIVYFVPYRHLPAGKFRSFRERERGFREGMESYGLPYDRDFASRYVFPMEPGMAELRPLVKEIVKRERPEAIIARNDEIAAMAMRALLELGVSIPDDIAVAGFDNRPFCEYLKPSLTSVDNRLALASRAAVESLVKAIEGQGGPCLQTSIEPEIVARESA
jgi:DNA-binding LacI/PurR family transcriptional regulator